MIIYHFIIFLFFFFFFKARQLGVNLRYSDEVHLDESLKDVYIDVDENKFSQVIRNLISNALKFTPRDGTVTVNIMLKEYAHRRPTAIEMKDKTSSIGASTDMLRISVTDTGYGIAKVC